MIINGNTDSPLDDWYNKVSGNNLNKMLSDSSDIDFIHIGLHRTGTTFLQRNIFPFCSKKNNIFSSEVIGGRYFDNGISNIETVHQYFPKAKIIIVLRNQISIMNSNYKNYVKSGGIWTFPKYVKTIIESNKYLYPELIRGYYDKFGKENCCVLFFEDFCKDIETYLNALYEFIDVEPVKEYDSERVNAASGVLYDEIVRIGNYCSQILLKLKLQKMNNFYLKVVSRIGGTADRLWFKSSEKPRTKHFGYGKALKMANSFFSKSNSELSEMFKRDLTEIGYK